MIDQLMAKGEQSRMFPLTLDGISAAIKMLT